MTRTKHGDCVSNASAGELAMGGSFPSTWGHCRSGMQPLRKMTNLDSSANLLTFMLFNLPRLYLGLGLPQTITHGNGCFIDLVCL